MVVNRKLDAAPEAAEQSAAFKLFHWFYMVKMKAADRLRDSDHDIFGVVIPADRELQKELARAEDFQYMTVADMAHVSINEGKYIALHDPTDAVVIYRMIDKHLNDWRNFLRYADPDEIPLEGLYEFDQLASMMINVARGYGLVSHLDRREVFKSNRILRAGRHAPKLNAARIVHTGLVFNEILQLAKSRGHNVWRFRRELNALEDAETKRGSVLLRDAYR